MGFWRALLPHCPPTTASVLLVFLSVASPSQVGCSWKFRPVTEDLPHLTHFSLWITGGAPMLLGFALERQPNPDWVRHGRPFSHQPRAGDRRRGSEVAGVHCDTPPPTGPFIQFPLRPLHSPLGSSGQDGSISKAVCVFPAPRVLTPGGHSWHLQDRCVPSPLHDWKVLVLWGRFP